MPTPSIPRPRPTALRRVLPGLALALAASPIGLASASAATDEFTIAVGDLIEPGVPGPGAGELEAPGDIDRYLIDLAVGDQIYLDDLPGGALNLRWRLVDPDAVERANIGIGSDIGRVEVDIAGTWVVEVFDNGNDTGQYSFTSNVVTDDGPFAVGFGVVVGPGVPGPGAGDIELPGNLDRYEFFARSGDEVFFESFDVSNFSLRWRCLSPSGVELYQIGIGTDGGLRTLDETGIWTIEVDDNVDAVGQYGLQLWPSNRDGPFALGLEQSVGTGVPFVGGGELETPGSIDTYEIELVAGTRVFFETYDISNFSLRWRAESPSGSELFDVGIGTDTGPFDVTESGTYTITVFDNAADTGTYGLTVWETRDDGPFAIGLEQPIGLDVPGAGAGSIDEPGDTDQYSIDLVAGQRVFFQSFNVSNFSLRWNATRPDGTELFGVGLGADIGPVDVDTTGTYTITVFDNGAATGTYECNVWEVDDDGPFAIELNSIVQLGAPAAGAGEIEDPGNADRYTIEGSAGDVWCFRSFDISNFSLRWRLESPSGELVFSSGIGTDHSKTLLTETGTHTVVVADNSGGDAVGTYAFLVNETTFADVNNDCFIDFGDLLAVLAAYGPCTPGEPCPEDVDGDGDVGFSDILGVLSEWTT
ncbi:MAG: hypothetical protein AB8G96_13665 [Phycisphaerales bacterium]